MVSILEDRTGWERTFVENWLDHYEKTGETNFKIYEYSSNEEGITSHGIDLSKSRLVFITTAGAYLRDSHEAYDAESPLGDYSLRSFPINTDFDQLAFAHTHYNHKFVDADPQVLLPLRHLEAMVAEGKIGELAPQVIAFSGYMPDVRRVLDEVIPQVVGLAKDQQADAALLVPA